MVLHVPYLLEISVHKLPCVMNGAARHRLIPIVNKMVHVASSRTICRHTLTLCGVLLENRTKTSTMLKKLIRLQIHRWVQLWKTNCPLGAHTICEVIVPLES